MMINKKGGESRVGRVALDLSSFNLLGINYLLFSLYAVFYLRNKQPPCQRLSQKAAFLPSLQV